MISDYDERLVISLIVVVKKLDLVVHLQRGVVKKKKQNLDDLHEEGTIRNKHKSVLVLQDYCD